MPREKKTVMREESTFCASARHGSVGRKRRRPTRSNQESSRSTSEGNATSGRSATSNNASIICGWYSYLLILALSTRAPSSSSLSFFCRAFSPTRHLSYSTIRQQQQENVATRCWMTTEDCVATPKTKRASRLDTEEEDVQNSFWCFDDINTADQTETLWDPQDFRADTFPTATTIFSSRQKQQQQQDEDDPFQLPPWLRRYYKNDKDTDDNGNDNDLQNKKDDSACTSLERFPTAQLQQLQESLVQNGFSKTEVQDILDAMAFYAQTADSSSTATATTTTTTSSASTPLLKGMLDFVQLILAENNHFQVLQEDDASTTTTTDLCEKSKEDSDRDHLHHNVFASVDVILAGIVHYAECVAARQEGIYDWFASTAWKATSKSTTSGTPHQRKRLLTAATATAREGDDYQLVSVGNMKLSIVPNHPKQQNTRSNRMYPANLPSTAKSIATSAAKIKRAEILANTILGVGATHRLTKDEAEGLRGLLLSSMEDWRALAIRCIASLFRLEGILEQQQHEQQEDSTSQEDEDAFRQLLPGLRSPEVVHTAQEAILVYATLAQRLGMHQLKAKIEERAFRILYQRQYRAVSSVYQQNGRAMHAIRSYVTQHINDVLHSDASLMANVEHLQVSSRVKEPYSFWKKLLKTKAKQRQQLPSSANAGKDNLSLSQVRDGIALRIIIKAKKATPEEPEETTRAREKLLCYYVQHLIRQYWPASSGGDNSDDDRIKDYIKYPKPNGYQSLHYTASLTYQDQDFPFEVQVRSEEMHRIAEYGVAAHWDYKLASTSQPNVVDTSRNKELLAIEAAATTDADDDSDNDSDETLKTIALPPASKEDADVILDTFAVPAATADDDDNEEIENVPQEKKETPSPPDQQLEYIDALVTARENLVQERVYVFVAGAASLTMEQGQLIILDSGSCIRDALAYMKEKAPEILQPLSVDSTQDANAATKASMGSLEPRVWRNGRQAEPDETIRSGDVILIELLHDEIRA